MQCSADTLACVTNSRSKLDT